MAVNSVFSGFTANQIKNNALFNKAKDNIKSKADNAKTDKTEKNNSVFSIHKKETLKTEGLSEKAQAYLAKLTEKYGDINFIITQGDVDGSEKSGAGAGSGKSYNCFISAELLEKMAADESVAQKYEGIIDDAVKQVDDLKQQTEAKGLGHLVASYGIRINEDGTTTFMAMLKEGARDLSGKMVDEKHRGLNSNSKEGILQYLEKWEYQRINNPGMFDSLDKAAEIGKEAAEKNAAAKKAAKSAAKNSDVLEKDITVNTAFKSVKGRKDGFDTSSMLPKSNSVHNNNGRSFSGTGEFRA
ncbi:MAG: DUF6033 family protein [Oscillospiraceae bacterium]|jgi:hypothetical protein|nr:DUF6033 family protein [Oscillospiraceae bacterium]